MRKWLVGSVFILVVICPPCVYPGTSLETVKGYVNHVLDILRDTALSGEAQKKAKKEIISAILDEMFDFTELSKRSLGQNWNRMNPDQQRRFVNLYKSLLKDTYMDRITTYTDEKLVFGKEIALSERTAEIHTEVFTKTARITINYRVIEEHDHWKVYDVTVEGVSLISNYRTQFKEILSDKSPEVLLERLRKKLGKIS